MTEIVKQSKLLEVNLTRFLKEISALNSTLPMQMIMIRARKKVNLDRLKEISIDFREEEIEGELHYKYKINLEKYDEHQKIDSELEMADIAFKIIPRNFVVSMISQYDAFLGELIRIIFYNNDNLIRNSEKEVKIEDLFTYQSIDEIKLKIIDKEVDSILRDEHCEQLYTIEKRISKLLGKEFKLTSKFPTLPKFIELTQRRNLFVHTNGMVTPQYLLNKTKFKFESEGQEINDELGANPKYCKNAFKILYEVAVKLTHVLWRNLYASELEESDDSINVIIYDLLKKGENDLAIIVSEFATTPSWKHTNEKIRKYILINKLIALNKKGESDKVKQIIDSEDWSVGEEFGLARLILLKKYDKAKVKLIEIGPNSKIFTQDAYKYFVLFDEFRSTEQFKEAYEEVFKEQFLIENETTEETQNKLKNGDSEEE